MAYGDLLQQRKYHTQAFLGAVFAWLVLFVFICLAYYSFAPSAARQDSWVVRWWTEGRTAEVDVLVIIRRCGDTRNEQEMLDGLQELKDGHKMVVA